MKIFVAVLMGIGISVSTVSGAIYYGDLVGIDMAFKNISEESFTDGLPLYGTPSISGDTLEFNNMLMGSFSMNGGGDMTDGILSATIDAKPNKYINFINFEEFGDVTLAGTPSVNPELTNASVTNSLFIKVREIDDVAITHQITMTINMVMTPSNGDWNIRDDGTFSGKLWQGELLVDLATELENIGETGRATLVDITMDNTLVTNSQSGTRAYIAKKENNGLHVTAAENPIPEPVTLCMLALGGLALVSRKR